MKKVCLLASGQHVNQGSGNGPSQKGFPFKPSTSWDQTVLRRSQKDHLWRRFLSKAARLTNLLIHRRRFSRCIFVVDDMVRWTKVVPKEIVARCPIHCKWDPDSTFLSRHGGQEEVRPLVRREGGALVEWKEFGAEGLMHNLRWRAWLDPPHKKRPCLMKTEGMLHEGGVHWVM